MPVNIDDLGVDLLSLSGHRFHGPKGVGVLYVREGIELESLVHGGQQERGLRAGTENVAAIAGSGKAAELAAASLYEAAEMAVLRDQLETGMPSLVPGAVCNGHPTLRLPNTLNMILPGLRGESVVIALGRRGIALSSGLPANQVTRSLLMSSWPWVIHPKKHIVRYDSRYHARPQKTI
ncbi:MAG: aminotransferase class V-fold PLP-dependent enzyme [Actinobacteria bacterium]|nr:aminotransferase class V-fold PLP-dependent enzyme [Actinomycetota bacterium]